MVKQVLRNVGKLLYLCSHFLAATRTCPHYVLDASEPHNESHLWGEIACLSLSKRDTIEHLNLRNKLLDKQVSWFGQPGPQKPTLPLSNVTCLTVHCNGEIVPTWASYLPAGCPHKPSGLGLFIALGLVFGSQVVRGIEKHLLPPIRSITALCPIFISSFVIEISHHDCVLFAV